MAFCNPEAWIAWLAQAEQFEVDQFVPDHGPLGTRADLALQRRFIADLKALVVGAIEEGLSVEETMGRRLPAPFDTWIAARPARWEGNISSMYERLSGRAVAGP
jgi:hypothetical protein